LISAKRLDLLIEACRSIGDGCELLIVGDGPERARLERIAAKRFPSTTFLGHQEGDALSIAFASADVFVLPGTGGLAIFEAMAYGKPVIVGQGDGTEADLVREGRNGRLVRPDDLGELTGAIRKYVGHPEMIVSEGRESRKIMDEEASIERMVLTFVSALKYAVEANT
jgi:glycosyltransferase involved in cell wall biosynthesis